MERIKQSAILFPNMKVYVGKRHCDCFKAAHEAGEPSPRHEVQGFITECGRFVDRKEGARIALECGQIKELGYSDKELFSEDLY